MRYYSFLTYTARQDSGRPKKLYLLWTQAIMFPVYLVIIVISVITYTCHRQNSFGIEFILHLYGLQERILHSMNNLNQLPFPFLSLPSSSLASEVRTNSVHDGSNWLIAVLRLCILALIGPPFQRKRICLFVVIDVVVAPQISKNSWTLRYISRLRRRGLFSLSFSCPLLVSPISPWIDRRLWYSPNRLLQNWHNKWFVFKLKTMN